MAVFGDADEREVFLLFLQHAACRAGVAIHAYAVMSTHAHLIATPATDTAIAKMMQRVGTRYGRYFNQKHGRIGAIWAGRYRAHVIDSVRYYLACLRYVERNPVEAGVAARPEDYRWSSYTAHALGRWPQWLTAHPVYLALGGNDADRQARYRALCDEKVTVEEAAWLEYVSSHEWRHGLVASADHMQPLTT